MRIIAKKKDYYDCIQAYGQDRSLVYVRTPDTVVLKEWPFPLLRNPWWYPTGAVADVTYREHIIGFCGKIYPLLEMLAAKDKAFCYTINELDAFLESHLPDKGFKAYCLKPRRQGYYSFACTLRRSDAEIYFNKCKEAQGNFSAMFEEKKSPVFIATYDRNKSEITYNPLLNQFEFYRLFDPFSAFQEIRMWWSNQAVPMRPIPEVSNEDLIITKGFDLKESFRKPPSKKKR